MILLTPYSLFHQVHSLLMLHWCSFCREWFRPIFREFSITLCLDLFRSRSSKAWQIVMYSPFRMQYSCNCHFPNAFIVMVSCVGWLINSSLNCVLFLKKRHAIFKFNYSRFSKNRFRNYSHQFHTRIKNGASCL